MNDERIFIKGREVASRQYVDDSISEFSYKLTGDSIIISVAMGSASRFPVEAAKKIVNLYNEYRKQIILIVASINSHLGIYLQTNYFSDGRDLTSLRFESLRPSGFLKTNKQTYGTYLQNTVESLEFPIPMTASYIDFKETDYNISNLLETKEGYAPNNDNQLVSKKNVNDAIAEAIGSISSFSLLPVDVLPTENIQTNIIYAVPSDDPKEKDVRIEYIYINDDWEVIGSTKIDLSNYYTKAEIDAKLAELTTLVETSTATATADEVADILNGEVSE